MFLKALATFSICTSVLVLSGCQSASGGKYAQLTAQGYTTSKLTSNRAGVRGWYVSKGNERYWCGMGPISRVEGGPTGMGIFLQSGRFMTLNKEAYIEHRGGEVESAPKYENIVSGRLKPEYVGRCKKV